MASKDTVAPWDPQYAHAQYEVETGMASVQPYGMLRIYTEIRYFDGGEARKVTLLTARSINLTQAQCLVRDFEQANRELNFKATWKPEEQVLR